MQTSRHSLISAFLTGILAAAPLYTNAQTPLPQTQALLAEAKQVDDKGYSGVHHAVSNGDLEKLKAYAAAGANLDASHPPANQTPLILAAVERKADIVRYLIESGKVDAAAGNDNGESLLYRLARNNDIELTQWAIAQGVPIVISESFHPLLGAAISGSEELVAFYIDAGIPYALPDHFGWIPLSLAAEFGNLATLQPLLKYEHSDDQLQAALKASVGSKIKQVTGIQELLLDTYLPRLTEEERKGELERIAAHAFAKEASDETLRLLLDRTAKTPDKTDGMLSYIIGAFDKNGEERLRAVKRAVTMGVEVNPQVPIRNSPIWQAAAKSDGAVLKFLIQSGADPYGYDAQEGNLLHAAMTSSPQAIAIVRELIVLGINVNALDQYGRTPLMHAAAHTDNVAIITTLLRAGADPTRVDNNGFSTLHHAQNNSSASKNAIIRVFTGQQ